MENAPQQSQCNLMLDGWAQPTFPPYLAKSIKHIEELVIRVGSLGDLDKPEASLLHALGILVSCSPKLHSTKLDPPPGFPTEHNWARSLQLLHGLRHLEMDMNRATMVFREAVDIRGMHLKVNSSLHRLCR